jgi:23S rRNA pseudouridine1911/1915/1917 synthase
MVVHPGAGNYSGTLANALAFRRKFQGANGEDSRPGIVHRLDKETSGLIIAAYDDEALAFLSDQFKARKARKTYAAIVTGMPKAKGRIETFIGRDPRDRKKFAVLQKGKMAVTYYKALKSWGSHSLVLLRPKTGRTHQLRVHLRFIGCPVLGDKVYGFNDRLFPDASLMLHARRLAITLPGNLERTVFTSPVPERFKRIVRCLNGLANGIQ